MIYLPGLTYLVLQRAQKVVRHSAVVMAHHILPHLRVSTRRSSSSNLSMCAVEQRDHIFGVVGHAAAAVARRRVARTELK